MTHHRLKTGQEITISVTTRPDGRAYASWWLTCREANGQGTRPLLHQAFETADYPTPEEAIQAAVDASTEETATGRLLPCRVYERHRHVVRPGGCECQDG